MTLEANEPTERGVEPLSFRTVEALLQVNVPAAMEVVQEAAAPEVDAEAELRAAHERGRREAMEAARHDLQEQVAKERAVVKRVVMEFEQEKQRYFNEVEEEVVKLSLAIAERVLHRETEMDPLLLTGAARVALEQVADSSEAVLRVAADDVSRWSETLKPMAKGMAIEADETMRRGEMVLKTKSGTVELGVRAQLQEIERGFFELLGRRPPAAA
jgi:flagellar assembly protein FliH